MNLSSIKQNPVKTILQFAIPSILAMVLTAMITVVDGFFIGNFVGKEGLAAINLGLPILYIYLAVGIMVGVGGVAIAGIQLGSGNTGSSNSVFNQTLVTTLAITFTLSGILYFLLKPIGTFAKMDGLVALGFMSYYSIMIAAYPLMMLNAAMGMFVRAQGHPALFMFISGISVVSNIVLDYLFIWVLGMGIAGAAYASLVAVVIGTGAFAIYFTLKSPIFKFSHFKFSRAVLRDTVLNGSSELIGQLSMCISMFAYNLVVLKAAGVAGVAAFTIVGYVAYLFNMVIVGFGQGSSPLISFSYGGKDYALSLRLRKLTNLFVLGAGFMAIALLFMSMEGYSAAFINEESESVKQMVQSGLSIFMVSFLFSGINTITSFYFTAIGRAKESALISASRGLVVLLTCILVLPLFWGMVGVWMVAPVTEGITLVLTLVLIRGTDPHLVACASH